MESTPTSVPATAKQVGDNPLRWSWVEPTVWTERMLTALEQGVKGDKWYALIDKVYAAANLRSAAAKVVANGGAAGVDHVTTKEFDNRVDEHVAKLTEQLRTGAFRPQTLLRKWIPKPGSRETQ